MQLDQSKSNFFKFLVAIQLNVITPINETQTTESNTEIIIPIKNNPTHVKIITIIQLIVRSVMVFLRLYILFCVYYFTFRIITDNIYKNMIGYYRIFVDVWDI